MLEKVSAEDPVSGLMTWDTPPVQQSILITAMANGTIGTCAPCVRMEIQIKVGQQFCLQTIDHNIFSENSAGQCLH